MKTINCKGTLIDLSVPRVMGIINITPDSFFDGGKTTHQSDILARATTLLEEGAAFLDIGGYSSRPGAEDVSEATEIERVIPAIECIRTKYPEALISIDTFRSNVAAQAMDAGACMVNDISGGQADAKMLEMIGNRKVPYILMHMRGTPQTMAAKTDYKDVTRDVIYYFSERLAAARKAGINDIIIDPGFGFAKNHQQGFELLNNLELFKVLDVPLLTGVSRKSMIYKILNITPAEALNGTTVLNSIALSKGASILRVHDVKQAVECVKLSQMLTKNDSLI